MIDEELRTLIRRPLRRARAGGDSHGAQTPEPAIHVHRMESGVPHRTTLDDRNQLLLYRLTSSHLDQTDAMRFSRHNWPSSWPDEDD